MGTLACYRDDGYWTLLFYKWSRILIGGRTDKLPAWGFVGRASISFLGGEPRHARLRSARIRRIRSTSDVRLWRLTCVWVTRPLPLQEVPYGTGSAPAGLSSAAGGAEDSA